MYFLLNLPTPIVVKELRGAQSTAEYQLEFGALKRLVHENIVKFIDAPIDYQHDRLGCPLIFMEFCEYGSMRAVLFNKEIIYSVSTIVQWARQLFRALDFLQQHEMVHQDIKPDNLLLTRHFVLKVSDFGIMRRPGDREVQMAGTPGYIAPELSKAAISTIPEEHQYKCDVYSAGIVCWELTRRKITSDKNYGNRSIIALGTPEAEIEERILCALNPDFEHRPSARALLKEWENLEFDYEWLPEHRRGHSTLLRPIGLDGNIVPMTAASEFGLAPPAASSNFSWSYGSFGSGFERIDMESGAYGKLMNAWMRRSELPTFFDDLITISIGGRCASSEASPSSSSSPSLATLSASRFIVPPLSSFARSLYRNGDTSGQTINQLRHEKIAEFKERIELLDVDGRERVMAECDHLLKGISEEKDAELVELEVEAEGEQGEEAMAVLAFRALLLLDYLLQKSCFLFAIQVMAACERGQISSEDLLRLLKMAKKNIEEVEKIAQRRLKFTVWRLGGSQYEWLRLTGHLVKSDLSEMRNESELRQKPMKTRKEVPLDVETVRRDGLAARISRIVPPDNDESLFPPISASEAELLDALQNQPIPGYYFLDDVLPVVTCCCQPKCAPKVFENPYGPEFKAPSCTSEDQIDFIRSHSFYSRALRYLGYWSDVEKHYELHVLIEELIRQSEKMGHRLHPVYLTARQGKQLWLYVSQPFEGRDAICDDRFNRVYGLDKDDFYLVTLRERIDKRMKPAIVKVEFRALAQILRPMAERLRFLVKGERTDRYNEFVLGMTERFWQQRRPIVFERII